MGQTRRSSFTLIELLVVVAIIALLISILLPSISAAKEQGKKTVCIANLSSIGKAMAMYFNENKDWFPFQNQNYPNGPWLVTAFYYGGHPGHPGDGYSNGVTPFDYDGMRDSFAGRPFNRYMYQNLQARVEQKTESGKPDFESRRKDMRQFFCPSDTGALYNTDSPDLAFDAPPTNYYQGSSYDINYQFVYLWAAGVGWGPPYTPYPRTAPTPYIDTANKFLKTQRNYNVSKFVILYEDAFDGALYDQFARNGWHKAKNKHSMLFLDSHAANIVADTTKGFSGPGWKTNAGSTWYTDPNDPDYQFRTLGP
ncbi:MAG: prepilin-type N-terminal cleavage/methylation domain-containing protein [Fimbriimonas ginsengisoli]|nr:prepilin-type N-terminal cleavage/methylation domain-containing protein [Fimbriimonas ginsengisoli]